MSDLEKQFHNQFNRAVKEIGRKRVKVNHSKSLDAEVRHTVLIIATDAIENITKNKYS